MIPFYVRIKDWRQANGYWYKWNCYLVMDSAPAQPGALFDPGIPEQYYMKGEAGAPQWVDADRFKFVKMAVGATETSYDRREHE